MPTPNSEKKRKVKPVKACQLDSSSPDFIVFGMGDDSPGTWLNAQPGCGGIVIDHANADGEMVFDRDGAMLLGARLIEWARSLPTPTKTRSTKRGNKAK